MKKKKKVIFGLNHSKTIKANMMIAEFMGIQVRTYEDGEVSYNPNESWDLLVPVYRKISSVFHGVFTGSEESQCLKGLGVFGIAELNEILRKFFNPPNADKNWTEEEWLNHAYLTIVKILTKIESNKQKVLKNSHKS